MIDIRPLAPVNLGDLLSQIAHYTSPARYRVQKTETDEQTIFTLELVQLDVPYAKRYEPYDDKTLQMYQKCASNSYSFGAYDGENLIGIALAEYRAWNNTLWVWEFHIAELYRGKGIGTQLMSALAERARQAGCRTICCETQTTNVAAIRFYRKVGFTLDGLNLSLYSGIDYPDGEIAVFMKRNLGVSNVKSIIPNRLSAPSDEDS